MKEQVFTGLLCSAAIAALAAGSASAQKSSGSPNTENVSSQSGSTTTDAPVLAPDATQSEPIVVIGTRLGLGSSTDVKQRALQSVSVLTAADIEKIPDTSLADVVRRVPGVAINENGGGGIITIRGLSDTEDRINGRNLTSTVGRGYDIAALPADLVSGVDVYKTPSASQIEGGIGGVIDFHTRRPFDFDGFAVGATAKAGYADLAKNWRPYLSGYVSDRWDTGIGDIGILVGGGYQRQSTTQNVARVDTNVATTDGAGNAVSAPSDAIKRQFFGGKTLTTGYASLQWRPDDRFEFTGDFLYNNEGLNFTTQSLIAQTGSATPDGAFTTYSGSDAFRSGNYTNVPLQASASQGVGYFRTYQTGLGGRFHQDRLTVSGDLSYTKTIFRYQAPAVTLSATAPTMSLDTGTAIPSFTVGGLDPTSASSWTYANYSNYVDRDSSSEWAYRGDAIYEIGGALKNIQVGLRYDKRDVGHQQNSIFTTDASDPTVSSGRLVGLTNENLWNSGYSQPQWLSPINVYANNAGLESLFGEPVGRPPYDPYQSYGASEKVFSGYGQLTFGFPLGGIPIDGNVGVRVAQTKLNVDGYQTVGGGDYAPIAARQKYTDVLPMVNVRAELVQKLYLRLSYSKQITRAPFYNLNPSLSLDFVNFTGSAGNPNLKPLRADQYDAALEWYFSKNNLLYAAGFYKDVSGYIRTEADTEVINGQNYLISRPQNVAKSWIAGFELGWQQRFSFLPGILSGLGVNASYTYIDDKKSANAAGYQVGLEQLSKKNYSIGVDYVKGPVTATVAYTYRSKILEATSGDAQGRPLYHAPYGQLDLSLSYALTPNINLLFSAVNLTQNRQTEVFLNRQYINQTFIEDRRIFGGVQVKFGAPAK